MSAIFKHSYKKYFQLGMPFGLYIKSYMDKLIVTDASVKESFDTKKQTLAGQQQSLRVIAR